MPRTYPALLAVLLLLPARLAAPQGGEDEPAPAPDLAGVWTSPLGDLVVNATAPGSFLGRLTEGDHGRTWHFQRVGTGEVAFFSLLDGKATTRKLDEQQALVSGADRFSLRLSDRNGSAREMTFQRILAPVPPDCAGARVTFSPAPRGRPGSDQNIDLRLVRALERAVGAARRVDPAFTRFTVSGSLEGGGATGSLTSRNVRAGLTLSKVNGASAEVWREEVRTALDLLRLGQQPVPDPRRDTARHAAALALTLLLETDIDLLVSPAVLDEDTGPWLDWWIARHAGQLPASAPSIAGWRARFSAMLEKTKALRSRMPDGIFVAVAPREGGLPLSRGTLERKWDRP
jgi:hypothetical protein